MGSSTTPAKNGYFYTSTKGGTQTLGQDAAYWPITSENSSVIYSQYKFSWWVDEDAYPTENKSKIIYRIQPVTRVVTAGYNGYRGCRSDSFLNITYNGVTENKWPWKGGVCRGYSGTTNQTSFGETGRYWYYVPDSKVYAGPNWAEGYIVLNHNITNQFKVEFKPDEGGAYKQNSTWTFEVQPPNREHVVYVYDNGWKKGTPYVWRNGRWNMNKEIYVYSGGWKAVKELKD